MLQHLIPFYQPDVDQWTFEARLLRWLTFSWLLVGLIILFSASYPVALYENGDGWFYFKRQLGWILVALLASKYIVKLPIKSMLKFSPYVYGFILVLVLATILGFGQEAHGAERWLKLGPITIQPSEFLKPFIILQCASLFGAWQRKEWMEKIIWLSIFAVSLGAILLQPNLSTTTLCGITIWLMALAAGLSFIELGGAAALGGLAGLASVMVNPYQMTRITSFRDPWSQAQGSGYQLVQSLLAIGSGRVWGAGFGMSQQKLFYLPIQYTDFIFAVFSEEFGFVGAIALILFIIFYATIALIVALKSKHPINRLVAVGVMTILVGQSLLNIGVATGSLPTTGIPFPMLSYGGSSVTSSIILTALLIRVAIELDPNQATISPKFVETKEEIV